MSNEESARILAARAQMKGFSSNDVTWLPNEKKLLAQKSAGIETDDFYGLWQLVVDIMDSRPPVIQNVTQKVVQFEPMAAALIIEAPRNTYKQLTKDQGPCSICHEITIKYGPQGNPICSVCKEMPISERGGYRARTVSVERVRERMPSKAYVGKRCGAMRGDKLCGSTGDNDLYALGWRCREHDPATLSP